MSAASISSQTRQTIVWCLTTIALISIVAEAVLMVFGKDASAALLTIASTCVGGIAGLAVPQAIQTLPSTPMPAPWSRSGPEPLPEPEPRTPPPASLRPPPSPEPVAWNHDDLPVRAAPPVPHPAPSEDEAIAIAVPIIANFEGFRTNAYRDVAGVPTIGYGFTAGVKMGDIITREDADIRLHHEVEHFANGVDALIKVPLSAKERAALYSWAYNVGLGAAERSTLIRKLNAGDKAGAADEFLRWVHAGNRVVAGLTRRRQREREIFLSGDSALA